MSEKLLIGTVWRDRKGGIYVITGHCRLDATYTNGVLLLGVGVGSSTTWICPIEEFVDGRFTNIDLRSEFSTAREEGFRAGRLAGIEEAAKVADSHDLSIMSSTMVDAKAREIAAAIRALKDKQS